MCVCVVGGVGGAETSWQPTGKQATTQKTAKSARLMAGHMRKSETARVATRDAAAATAAAAEAATATATSRLG